MEHKFDFGYLDSFDIEKEWENSVNERLEEFNNFSVGSKFSIEINLLHSSRVYPENISVEFLVDEVGDNNLFTSFLKDKPKTIKKLFSETKYDGGILYKIFSDLDIEEFEKISNKFSKIIICSSNNDNILSDYKVKNGLKISDLIILILNDGFIIGTFNGNNDSRNCLNFTPSFVWGNNKYLKLTDLIKNHPKKQTDFLQISLQLFLKSIYNKSKTELNERFYKFKKEGQFLLDVFEKTEKDLKERFLKIEGINNEIETDLMNSFSNIKKIKNEVLKSLNLVDINDYYVISSEKMNYTVLNRDNDKINLYKELLQHFDFYMDHDKQGYPTYNSIFIDFYLKSVPFFETLFSKTYELIELYISQLTIIISIFDRIENGMSSREYKLLKSEIQESGIFLNVFETLNLEKLENINLSIEKLTNLTEILGLKMINQLSEINLTLNQINENISQLRIETTDNLQKINYNLQINNLYSLIGLFQNKRMNRTLTNINNSSN